MPSSKMILVARVIGRPLTNRLMENFGGSSVHVPPLGANIHPKGKLANCIGVEATKKLVAHWGGRSLYIPNNSKGNAPLIISLLKNKLVIELYDYGVNLGDIARGLYLSKRRIESIIKDRERWLNTQDDILREIEKHQQRAEIREKILRGMLEGKTKIALAKELGVSRGYITKILLQEQKLKYYDNTGD